MTAIFSSASTPIKIPERSSPSVRTIARQLGMRKKDVNPSVNPSTFAGMESSTVTLEVFRVFQYLPPR